MQARYQFDLTDGLVQGLFRTRSKDLRKKTKLGKIRYVMNQMIEREKKQSAPCSPDHVEVELDISEEVEKLDTCIDQPVSQAPLGSPKQACKEHDFQWKVRTPQKECQDELAERLEVETSYEEVPTVPSEVRVIDASEDYQVTEPMTVPDERPCSPEGRCDHLQHLTEATESPEGRDQAQQTHFPDYFEILEERHASQPHQFNPKEREPRVNCRIADLL